MATSQILQDDNTIVAEIFIAAPPARVFEAISDPKQIALWWGQQGLYRLTETKTDFRVGGKWRNDGVGDDGRQFHVEGEYLEIDPPRLLIHTWNPSYRDLPETIVRWELEPISSLEHGGTNRMGAGTLLKIHHSGFAGNEQDAKDHAEGWKRVLGWLQDYVNEGKTVETRTA